MSKIILIPILIFLSFLVIFYFVYPKYDQTKSLEQEIIAKEQDLQKKQDYFSFLKASVKELQEYDQAVESVQSALPHGFSTPSLFAFFYEQASLNGLVLKSIAKTTPELTTEETNLKEAGFALSLEGGIGSFESFLKGLEKSSRIIEIDSFAFEAEENDFAEFVLQVKTYYYVR